MIIETKCILVHNDDVDLYKNLGVSVDANEIEVDISLNMRDISGLRRDTNKDGSIDPNTCVIYMNSGDRFVVKDSYDRLLPLFKGYYKI